jgi:hypothetical protein
MFKYINLAVITLLFTGCSVKQANEISDSVATGVGKFIIYLSYFTLLLHVIIIVVLAVAITTKNKKLTANDYFLGTVTVISLLYVFMFVAGLPYWWDIIFYTLGIVKSI